MNIIRYDLAMHSAYVGEAYTCTDDTYEGINWLSESEEKPTKKELELVWESIKSQVELSEIVYNRSMAYPSIVDQLDQLYWDKKNNTNTWEAGIDAVKAEFPKGV